MYTLLISRTDGASADVWFRSIDAASHISVTCRADGTCETSVRFLDEDPPIVILSGDHRESLAALTKAEVRAWLRDNAHRYPSTFDKLMERVYATKAC